MDNIIYTKIIEKENLPINRKEITRYAGIMNAAAIDETSSQVMEEVIKDLENAFSYKLCYGVFDSLPFDHSSKNLEKLLAPCSQVILFAATIGTEIDRYIKKWQRLSPVKALFAQAYGAERVETLCDFFCEEMKKDLKENQMETPRYSPGYGDLPLDHQKDLFRILNISKNIGISLGDSLLMSPSKSVTAIFGIKEKTEECTKDSKCSACENIACEFRKI